LRWWLRRPLPSADALGDGAAALSLHDLREILFGAYTVLKRNKALRPLPGGLFVLILDAHEMGASYLRSSSGSLTRRVQTAHGEREQFYYRHVAALLLHAGGQLLLDVGALGPGEGEIAAATRLFERGVRRYPRAFHVAAGDSLYLDPAFCRLVVERRKHFVVVLKNEHRDLVVDARSLFPGAEPLRWDEGSTRLEAWDIPGFTTWPQYGSPVRVVRTVETRTVVRQRTGQPVEERTEWLWATDLSPAQAPTKVVVRIGHGRWTIENQGFNELVTEWHADHLYKNAAHAIAALYLLLFLAYNLFHAFLGRNLKPAVRRRYTARHIAQLIRASYYILLRLTARCSRSP
jgi:hypothetical protein